MPNCYLYMKPKKVQFLFLLFSAKALFFLLNYFFQYGFYYVIQIFGFGESEK